MTITPRISTGVIILAATLLGGVAARADVVYQNASTYLGKYSPGTLEVGDQIFFSGTARDLTSFEFQLFGTGTEQAAVRFYRNDGPGGAPGEKIFDSGFFTVPNRPTGSVIAISDFVTGASTPMNVPLPNSMTWSIQFTANTASVGIFHNNTSGTGADIGASYIDIWEKGISGTWSLIQPAPGSGLSALSFGATFNAVPEPSTMALSLIGLIGLAGCALKRRMS